MTYQNPKSKKASLLGNFYLTLKDHIVGVISNLSIFNKKKYSADDGPVWFVWERGTAGMASIIQPSMYFQDIPPLNMKPREFVFKKELDPKEYNLLMKVLCKRYPCPIERPNLGVVTKESNLNRNTLPEKAV